MPTAIVLPLAAAAARELALPSDFPGALSAEDLHLTLGMVRDGATVAIVDVESLAAALGPVVVCVDGLGRFEGESDDAFHLTVSGGEDLLVLRQCVEDLLGPDLDCAHAFTPHITLAYLPRGAVAPIAQAPDTTLALDTLALWDGPTRHAFALRCTMTLAPIQLDAIELPSKIPTELLLFREGWTDTTKGRFLMDAEGGRLCEEHFSKHGVELALDFDHATFAPPTGQKRDVPGYTGGIEYREGDGLYAVRLRWTAVGLAAISPGRGPDGGETIPEYRYFSPAIHADPDTRRVIAILPVALVPWPSTHDMPPLVMSADGTLPEIPMKNVCILLGLGAETTEDKVVAEVRTLQSQNAALLGALACQDVKTALPRIARLAAAELRLDALEESVVQSQAAAAESEKAKLAAETQASEAEARAKLIADAYEQGKLTPAQEELYKDMSLDELKKHLDAAAPNPALARKSATKQPDPTEVPSTVMGVPDLPLDQLSAMQKQMLLTGSRPAFKVRLDELEKRRGPQVHLRAALDNFGR